MTAQETAALYADIYENALALCDLPTHEERRAYAWNEMVAVYVTAADREHLVEKMDFRIRDDVKSELLRRDIQRRRDARAELLKRSGITRISDDAVEMITGYGRPTAIPRSAIKFISPNSPGETFISLHGGDTEAVAINFRGEYDALVRILWFGD